MLRKALIFILAIAPLSTVSASAIDHRVGVVRIAHVRIIVVDGSEQGRARDLEVLEIMAVPHDGHGVGIVEGHVDALVPGELVAIVYAAA